MAKRSDFKRKDKDFYRTWDKRATPPLLPHLPLRFSFDEPCSGDGALYDQLATDSRRLARASDIETHHDFQDKIDVFDLTDCQGDMFITNPPWSRDILHPLIVHLSNIAPTWLLFDADWAHTKQSTPYMALCQKIVSVGRLRWIEGSKHDGKDNCAWYLFDKHGDKKATEFYGRL